MSKAKGSVERLFKEPFEPVWLKRQRETKERKELEEFVARKNKENKWRQYLIDSANLKWKLEAAKSHARIMAKVNGVHYSN